MRYGKLGTTDISISVIAMGCWAFAGGQEWGPQDDEDSIAAVHCAMDSGVNFFDTAEGYGDGRSESVLGKALAGRRHKAVIATKASANHLSRTELPKACERSLERLNTDYIDLYQIHWPNWEIPISETVEALDKLRTAGKVRAIGVCNYGMADLSDLLTAGHCETDQLPYSLLWRATEYEALPTCVDNDIGVLCYTPLAQGLLTGKFASADAVPTGRARTRHFSKHRPLTRHSQCGFEVETFAAIERIRQMCCKINATMAEVALAWLLHQRGVTSVLTGARQAEQIRQNAQAATLKVPSEILDELTQATEELKLKLGPNVDQYQLSSRIR